MFPDVNRKAIAGMRDKLIHQYSGAGEDPLW